jgi:hypothetical protein
MPPPTQQKLIRDTSQGKGYAKMVVGDVGSGIADPCTDLCDPAGACSGGEFARIRCV